jgi:hypothetical protein
MLLSELVFGLKLIFGNVIIWEYRKSKISFRKVYLLNFSQRWKRSKQNDLVSNKWDTGTKKNYFHNKLT